MTVEANDFRVECGNCRHQWLALSLPMPLLDACKRMSALTCPQCGAPNARIFVAMNPKPQIFDEPASRDLPPMTADGTKGPVLMSPENPNGWKLEELLGQIVAEVEVKCRKIERDQRPIARTVLMNNRAIIARLAACAGLQRESMALLESIGPNQGPLGKPRIGVGSEP